jgi:hypothetical protein
MTNIVGLDNGRIFLGGRDGSTYEIVYQHQVRISGSMYLFCFVLFCFVLCCFVLFCLTFLLVESFLSPPHINSHYSPPFSQDGWFASRCRKINHTSSMITSLLSPLWSSLSSTDRAVVHMAVDTQRHLLLTLSKNSSIDVSC